MSGPEIVMKPVRKKMNHMNAFGKTLKFFAVLISFGLQQTFPKT